MSEELTLEVGQANEIKLALRRARGSNGSLWTPDKVKLLTEHDTLLGHTLDVLEGRAEVVERGATPVKYEVVPGFLPIWKRFRVGALDKPQLQVKLKEAGRDVSNWGEKLFNHPDFTTSPEPKDVLFAKVNLAFLGFKMNPKTKDWLHAEFFADWSRKHLQDGWVMELCELEDGPSIGYQHAASSQPNGEILWLAHKPVVVEGVAHVWYVERLDDGRLWLYTDCAVPEREWSLDGELLLRLRKIQALAT